MVSLQKCSISWFINMWKIIRNKSFKARKTTLSSTLLIRLSLKVFAIFLFRYRLFIKIICIVKATVKKKKYTSVIAKTDCYKSINIMWKSQVMKIKIIIFIQLRYLKALSCLDSFFISFAAVTEFNASAKLDVSEKEKIFYLTFFRFFWLSFRGVMYTLYF